MGGHSNSPARTPAENMAYSQAQPFLQEYNSGQLNAADQAAVNVGDTNTTGSVLQKFATQGMSGSSALANLVGTVKKGGATGGMQAGAGSVIDLNRLSSTQAILQSDLQIGMSYLGIASGQAADMAAVQQEHAAALAQALGTAAQAAGNIISSRQSPGTNVDAAVNRYAAEQPTAASIVNGDTNIYDSSPYLGDPSYGTA